MTTIRVAERSRWTTVSNDLVEDESLTWEARGLLIYLLSKPDNWTVNRQHLAGQAPNGETQVRRILAELTSAGYIVRRRFRQDGQLLTETTVYESPAAARAVSNQAGQPPVGDHPAGSPPALVRTEEQGLKANPPNPPAGGVQSLDLDTPNAKMLAEQRFEEFVWQPWPARDGVKAGKQTALRRWLRLPIEEQRAVAKATPHYIEWCERNTRFVMDCSTFLNPKEKKWEPFVAGVAPPADPADAVAAASFEAAEKKRQRRADGTACDQCYDSGVYIDPADPSGRRAIRCTKCAAA